MYETLLETRFIASAESTVTSVMPDFTCCYVFFFISKRANSKKVMFVINMIITFLKRTLAKFNKVSFITF